MSDQLPEKVQKQMEKAGLPTTGEAPFIPLLGKNRSGEVTIEKALIRYGRKKGKMGFVDSEGRIWIKDRAHAGDPDRWDVQEDGGKTYYRVDLNGKRLD